MTLLGLVELSEGDDVRVIEHLKNLGFLERLFLLSLAHLSNVHLLNDAQVTIALTLHEVSFSKGTLSQELFLFVHLEKWLRLLANGLVGAFHLHLLKF